MMRRMDGVQLCRCVRSQLSAPYTYFILLTALAGQSLARERFEVIVEREPDTIVVRLRDEAPAFDPTTYPAPDLTVPLEEPLL